MKNSKARNGFTIIEVVLVLAIAGLIFLMVFIALPALQRGQRDTQRRDDVARFMAQINQYQVNNRGKVPSLEQPQETSDFLTSYMKQLPETDPNWPGEFQDPQTGDNYVILGSNSGNDLRTVPEGEGTKTILYATNARCDGENITFNDASRSVAARIQLEGSGFYCQDNQ